MKLAVLTIALVFSHVAIRAQKIQGLVKSNETKQPLSGASVTMFGITTLSDEHGAFTITLAPKGNVLTVSHMGYRSY